MTLLNVIRLNMAPLHMAHRSDARHPLRSMYLVRRAMMRALVNIGLGMAGMASIDTDEILEIG